MQRQLLTSAEFFQRVVCNDAPERFTADLEARQGASGVTQDILGGKFPMNMDMKLKGCRIVHEPTLLAKKLTAQFNVVKEDESRGQVMFCMLIRLGNPKIEVTTLLFIIFCTCSSFQ